MERPLSCLPLEFCGRLGAIAPLGSLQTLSLVSKAAYKFFNPLLYGRIDRPKSTEKLLITLANQRRIPLGAHPASFVRELVIGLTAGSRQYMQSKGEQKKNEEAIKYTSQLVLRALDNIACVSGGQSHLRSLYFSSNAALEDIGPLLRKRTRFLYLEDLRIFVEHGLATQRKNFQVRQYRSQNEMV